MTWIVEVVSYDDGEVVKTFPCTNERYAEKVSRGISINMSEDYFARVVRKVA